MNIETIFVFLFIFALVAYWGHHNSIGAKAVEAAKNHTSQQGLQFLDQGVVLVKVSLAFTQPIKFNIIRIFRFEFSSKGDRRYLGWVTMKGARVQSVSLQPFSESSLH